MAAMSAPLPYPQKHSISAEEYLRMGEAGVFPPDARLELLEGEIYEMAPIGSPHAGLVNRLTRLLVRPAGEHAVVAVQNPFILSGWSVPQPDLALLRARADDYMVSHPRPGDVLVPIEVADTTLGFDLGRKAPLYARGGIPEAWVVDVNARVIHVHREPADGGYATNSVARPGDRVSCAALPDVFVEVAELFPG